MDTVKNRLSQIKGSLVTKDEVVEASKAILDVLEKKLGDRLDSTEKSLSNYGKKLETLETGVILHAGKMIDKLIGEEVAKHLAALSAVHQEKVLELEKAHRAREVNTISRVSKALEEEFSKRIEVISGKGGQLAEVLKSYELGYQAGLDQVKMLLQALPVPQVNVTIPDHAIQVKQLPSHVSFNLPDQAIQVKMMPSHVDVHIPEKAISVQMEKSIVNIHPEVKSPDVHVNMPRRRVKKLITYGEDNRPMTVTEIEEEDK